ncbi:MAG: Npt1/Npt2 family nucleotide transporter [Byssovorax sp.]
MLHRLSPANRAAAGAFLTLATVMAGHAILETARDALFLARLPVARLPWVYLAVTLGVILVARAQHAFARFQSRRVLAVMLGGASIVTLGFWLAFAWTRSPMVLYGLYVWVGLYATTIVTQFWLVVSELYTITQAKRVYAFIGAGGVLGAVVGSGAARGVTALAESRHLILAACVPLVASCVASIAALGSSGVVEPDAKPQDPPQTTLRESLQVDPYVLRLTVLALVSTIGLTGVNYLFNSAVVAHVEPEKLGTFFATLNIVENGIGLVAQIFLVPWLLRVLSVSRALTILPALFILGALGIAFGFGLLPAILLVASDGSLRYSLHNTGVELLYVPIARESRGSAKRLADIFGRRGGQVVASLAILVVAAYSNVTTILAVAITVIAVLWIALALDIKRHYLDLFRAKLQRGGIEAHVELPPLDLVSLEILIAALSSSEDSEVIEALDLLEAEDRARLVPALILYHPSRAVVLRALGIFERSLRQDFIVIADRLLSSSDPEVRAAALRARSVVRPSPAVLRVALEDSSEAVRATALVGLAYPGVPEAEKARRDLEELAREGSTPTKIAIARAMRDRPGVAFDEVLAILARSEDPALQCETAAALERVGGSRFLPLLLPMLAKRRVRSAARAAFAAMGKEGLDFLARSLADRSLPPAMRRYIPRTLSYFRARDAAPMLLRGLIDEPDSLVRFQMLRALGRIRQQSPRVRFDRKILAEAIERTVSGTFQLIGWRVTLARGVAEDEARATAGGDLLDAILRDRQRKALERLFRLLGLAHPGEDWKRMYLGLESTDPVSRASSRELLEHTLDQPLRGAVLALVDDMPDAERLSGATPFHPPEEMAYEALLGVLLESGGETIQCLAAYHVGELGLEQVRPHLEQILTSGSPFTASVVQRAIELLDDPDREVIHSVRYV